MHVNIAVECRCELHLQLRYLTPFFYQFYTRTMIRAPRRARRMTRSGRRRRRRRRRSRKTSRRDPPQRKPSRSGSKSTKRVAIHFFIHNRNNLLTQKSQNAEGNSAAQKKNSEDSTDPVPTRRTTQPATDQGERITTMRVI